MSSKLNQSLDEIVSTQRRAAGGRRRTQRPNAGRPAASAPVGGVQKTSKQPRAAANKQNPSKATGGSSESKVVVSNLPKDVTEAQIKEYFRTSVGPIKKVDLAYGPGGVSRGNATVIFSQPDGASKAFSALNGLLVDSRPIKIEIIVSADKAAAIAPTPKTLTERISQPKGQPKAQPKSAANDKKKNAAGKASGSGAGSGAGAATGGRGKRRARSARPAKKTAEELDSEMADYFEAGNNENTNGTSAAAGGDAVMDEEIL